MSATLQVVSSGSQGNCYILSCNYQKLILELGVPFRETLKALNFGISSVVGCCVGHIHGDHSKGIKDALSYGLQIFSCANVAERYPNVKVIEPMKRVQIGGFKVMALPVEHNVECYGYVIDHPNMGRLVFYTDTKSFNYKIPNVNFILGEVNYSDDAILDNLCNGYDVRSQYDNHLSLDTAISVIRRLYSPELSKVICCHLSSSNADISEIKRRFKSELGITPLIAENNTRFILQKEDF